MAGKAKPKPNRAPTASQQESMTVKKKLLHAMQAKGIRTLGEGDIRALNLQVRAMARGPVIIIADPDPTDSMIMYDFDPTDRVIVMPPP